MLDVFFLFLDFISPLFWTVNFVGEIHVDYNFYRRILQFDS